MDKFLILGLPRSRTYWFSKYFSQGGSICTHEAAWTYPDYSSFLLHSIALGDSTTMYPTIREFLGDQKKVFIHRPLGEVIDSMNSIDLSIDHMIDYLEYSDQILKEGKGLHIPFNEINDNIDIIWRFIGKPQRGSKNMLTTILNNDSLIREFK